MTDKETYNSFFVRLIKSGPASSNAEVKNLRYEIEHFQSGKFLVFESQEAFFDLFLSFTAPQASEQDSD
jgi:hypothetical protein